MTLFCAFYTVASGYEAHCISYLLLHNNLPQTLWLKNTQLLSYLCQELFLSFAYLFLKCLAIHQIGFPSKDLRIAEHLNLTVCHCFILLFWWDCLCSYDVPKLLKAV